MIASRTASRISLAAGVVVVLFSLSGLWFPAPKACGNLPNNYAPIIAFEMARSVSDLHAIFGNSESACRQEMSAYLDQVDWIDWLLYIPLYGSFLVFCFFGLKPRAPKVASMAIVLTLIACASDYIENKCLFELSGAPDQESEWFMLLFVFTESKWVGLGIATALGGWLIAKKGGAWRIALVTCALALVAALISIPNPALIGPYLSNAFALGWLTLLLFDFSQSRNQPDSSVV